MGASPFARIGISIDALELSVRAQNALRRWRSDLTVQQLAETPDDVLRRIPHLGARTVREIRDAIAAIAASPRSEVEEVMLWAEAHRTLVLALMRGEAVIVPVDRLRVTGISA